MPVRLGVSEEFTLVVDGPDDAGVVEVAAAFVDIVDDEDVAGVDVAGELADHRFRRVVQGADVRGDVAGALHDRVALGIADGRGEVTRS